MEVRKSQKGADDIIMKRKIYQQLLDWKEQRNGEGNWGIFLIFYKGTKFLSHCGIDSYKSP